MRGFFGRVFRLEISGKRARQEAREPLLFTAGAAFWLHGSGGWTPPRDPGEERLAGETGNMILPSRANPGTSQ